MITLQSRMLPKAIQRSLARYQAAVDAGLNFEARVALAASEFRRRNRKSDLVFKQVRSTLMQMCAGARRCMYCEDSVADELEHHRPKQHYPGQVFVWENYLYACGPCNGPKNDNFAILRADGTTTSLTRSDPPAEPPHEAPYSWIPWLMILSTI